MIYLVLSMYKGFRFPREVISHCVWLYHRFPLSLREIELMMAARGIEVTYETIRTWCARFGPEYARRLRRHQQGRCQVVWGSAVFGCSEALEGAVGQAVGAQFGDLIPDLEAGSEFGAVIGGGHPVTG